MPSNTEELQLLEVMEEPTPEFTVIDKNPAALLEIPASKESNTEKQEKRAA